MASVTAIQLRRVPPFELGLTLGDFLIPIRLGERFAIWQRNLLLIVAGTILLTVGAYVSFNVPAFAIGNLYVPANEYVPFTLQTFGVLFTGALLGARRGIASIGLYLLIGAIGFPVFAADANGVHASGIDTIATVEGGRLILGTTGGYLLGFLVAGALVGRLAELGWDRHVRGSIAAMALGSIVIYAIGVTWLAIAANLSLDLALQYGLYPFLPGDVVKLLVAAGLLPVGWRMVARRDNDL
jgi:biotin transport system substrate-specific component